MAIKRYQALGPLLAGEGSRAFIGLEISNDGRADPVVLVWVPEGTEKDPALLERIRKETEHAARLDHPNIVRVHGLALLDEGYARVVEFADGESLRKLLEIAKKLPPRFAAKIVCDAAMGVHYAHMAGNDDGSPLVHGDIRPETLLLSFSGAVKVTGYGALAFAPRETGGQRVKGRRVHIAPEQIIGGREAFTIQTDVYLLGLTLHECLTGLVPFADQNDFFDHAVLTLPLQPPPPGEVPEALEKIIYRACSKKVPERYATPLQLREEIEKAMGGVLPSNEELAAFLKTFFPDSDQTRAARRQAIDAGVADYARKVWAERKMEPVFTPSGGTPMFPPIKTPMAIAAVEVKAPAAKPPVSRVSKPAALSADSSPSLSAVHSPPRSRTPVLIGVAVTVAIGLVWWAAGPRSPAVPKPEPRAAVTIAPAAVPIAVIAVIDAGPAEVVDAGSASPAVVATGVNTAAPPSDLAEVTIDVDPNVELTVEGKLLGRTPWTGRLTPGRKVLQMLNRELGIKTSRAITVVAGEKTDEKYKLNQGFVTLSAPDGAQVFINERRIGSAPIRGEIPVYEGAHRISVTVGKARWNETFNLAPGQRINFNVEMH